MQLRQSNAPKRGRKTSENERTPDGESDTEKDSDEERNSHEEHMRREANDADNFFGGHAASEDDLDGTNLTRLSTFVYFMLLLPKNKQHVGSYNAASLNLD